MSYMPSLKLLDRWTPTQFVLEVVLHQLALLNTLMNLRFRQTERLLAFQESLRRVLLVTVNVQFCKPYSPFQLRPAYVISVTYFNIDNCDSLIFSDDRESAPLALVPRLAPTGISTDNDDFRFCLC